MNKPKSANHPLSLIFGFLSFCGFVILQKGWSATPETKALFGLAITTVAIAIIDLLFYKVHRRPSTGLRWESWQPSFSRAVVKWIGLMGILLTIGLLYKTFPEYQGAFYDSFFKTIDWVVLPFSLVSFFYIYILDGALSEPKDGYWNVGLVFLLQFEKVEKKGLVQFGLGWLVKAFFMPLMFTYFVTDIEKYNNFDFSTLNNFKAYFDFLYDTIFLIDVGFVSMGYAVSLKLLDSHIRSTEPTLTGWVVALSCYQPFWSTMGRQYLKYNQEDQAWDFWLAQSPTLYILWGSGILVLFGIYVWSSIMFGYRFSNLTHRGIITDGPYRWLKHPAYVCKNTAYWLISMPFLSQLGVFDAFKKSLMLIALNLIYYFRARTEERHLMVDPEYQAYSHWIQRNGLVAKIFTR